jgi:hypothetical protein
MLTNDFFVTLLDVGTARRVGGAANQAVIDDSSATPALSSAVAMRLLTNACDLTRRVNPVVVRRFTHR